MSNLSGFAYVTGTRKKEAVVTPKSLKQRSPPGRTKPKEDPVSPLQRHYNTTVSTTTVSSHWQIPTLGEKTPPMQTLHWS